jgi:hypothetical protein
LASAAPALAAIPCGDGYGFEAICLEASSPAFSAAWQAQFEAEHGHEPTIQDMMDRDWSIQFYATFGRDPTDQDWANHFYQADASGESGAS